MKSPKPTAEQICIVLRRAVPISESNEALLIIAILSRAVMDAMLSDNYAKRKLHHGMALKFFSEGIYRPYCELVNLDPDWVGKLLRDYAGIECGARWGREA